MFVYNTIKNEATPWLATSWVWSTDNKKLTFTLRDGVKWSDGQPFSANDVAFTFNLLKQNKALRGNNVWDYLSAVKAIDAKSVEFTFARLYTIGLYDLGQQVIVPEHLWKNVQDPLQYANENPVGTGPFTEVVKFENQVWELDRNPNYWQPGKPYIKGMRFPAYSDNDQANLATVNGENDWSGDFIPDIEKTYIAKDPQNHNYWFLPTGDTVMLYVNTTRKPFDDVNVRKAISMCLDRSQIVKVAMYDYTHPADGTGLSDAYQDWKSPDAVAAGSDWVKRDVAKANQMLTSAGLTQGPGGMRTFNGQPLQYDINVVSGWSDWVSTSQIISQNLKQCGITAGVKTYDYSAWEERVQKGDFDMSIGWSTPGITPFQFYRGQMSNLSYHPLGELSVENWQRYKSADADTLLDQIATSTNLADQKKLASQLQMVFAKEAPAIPLFPGPEWYEYNTSHFTGFPTKDNPYSIGSVSKEPERLLVLTSIKPK
jgi:peptide/nickel transport system substrate-binding protein